MAKTKINGKTKAERTKEMIYSSALGLFRKKGFDRVTVEEITRHAGTAKGSFYTYYTTKSDIIVDAFWSIDAYYRSIESQVLAVSSGTDRLLKFTDLQMQYVRDTIGCEMLKILYSNQVLFEGSDKVITDRKRFWHTFIQRIIEEGQESGELRKDLPAYDLALYFNRSIRGMFLDWNIGSDSFDLVETAHAYCSDFILKSLRPQ